MAARSTCAPSRRLSPGTPKRGKPVFSSMNTWRQSSMTIRDARPRDLDAIARLENESFETDRVSRRSLREFLRAPHRPVIAGDYRRRTGGLRSGLAAQGRAGLAHLLARGRCAVRPPRRWPGAPAGLRGLWAPSPPRRRSPSKCATITPSAIALYESCGFRQFGEHAHYYADGATALRYEKPLLPVLQNETGNNSPSERVRPLRRASRPR